MEGGIKGFLMRASSSFYAGGMFMKDKGWIVAKKAGNLGFMVATTSIVVLMPLIFEIMREGQVCLCCIYMIVCMLPYVYDICNILLTPIKFYL